MNPKLTQNLSVMIVANGGRKVGWGHIMRCCSIGDAIKSLGGHAVFAVMNRESASLVSALGFDCRILENSSFSSELDVALFAQAALETKARIILVDSYDVSPCFFHKLSNYSFAVGYMDDLYFEREGRLEVPARLDVDLVINYGFSFNDANYSCVYADSRTRCLIGPSYAPIRSHFSHLQSVTSPRVDSILLTSGSTNPNHALERMLSACEKADLDAELNIVIGENAFVDIPRESTSRIVVHESVNDLSELMIRSDIVVSSAGSTLYELACLGIPTIALPVAQNQLCNSRGFLDRDLGLASSKLNWDSADVQSFLVRLAADYNARKLFSARMRETVDGKGSERIARQLLEIV